MGKKARAKRERRQEQQAGVEPASIEVAPEVERAPLDRPLPVTDATFDDEVLASELPVLVDFWAPWCGPCRMVAPVLDELARSLAGQLKIVKYNTAEQQRVAQAMNIRSIPTMVLFVDGEVADVQIGALPRDRLEAWLRRRVEPKRSLLGRLLGRPAAAG